MLAVMRTLRAPRSVPGAHESKGEACVRDLGPAGLASLERTQALISESVGRACRTVFVTTASPVSDTVPADRRAIILVS